MKNIILTSNGFINSSPRSKEIDELFQKITKEKKVLIIGNATLGGSNASQREAVKNNFENVGAKQVDIIDITKENINDILTYEIVYTMGGDPRYLLDLVETTNIKEILTKFLKSGGIYIGESAGSMILGNNLKWIWEIKKGTKPKYDIEPTSYEGLGFTTYNIFPHWNTVKEDIKKKVLEYSETSTPLIEGEFIEIEAFQAK